MASSIERPVEVFLDTSIPVARLKGEDIAATIHEELDEFQWIATAAYVQLEYGNVILSKVCYFRDRLAKLGSLEKLRYHVANRLRENVHGAHRTWGMNLLSRCFSEPEATQAAREYLDTLWELGPDLVGNLCDYVHDSIGCVWVDQRGKRRWQKPTKCEHRRPGCKLPEFFQENRATFGRMRDEIRDLPPSQQTDQLIGFADVIDEAWSKPTILRKYEKCRKLADAIIAAESREYRGFFTQNIRESNVLCKVLEQLLVYLPQSPEGPVEYRDYRGDDGHRSAEGRRSEEQC